MNNYRDDDKDKKLKQAIDSSDFMKNLKEISFGNDDELLEFAQVNEKIQPISSDEEIDFEIKNDDDHVFDKLFSQMSDEYKKELEIWKLNIIKSLTDFFELKNENFEQNEIQNQFEYDEKGIHSLSDKISSFKDFMLSEIPTTKSFKTSFVERKNKPSDESQPKKYEAITDQFSNIDFAIYGVNDFETLSNASIQNLRAITWTKHAMDRLHERITDDLVLEKIKKEVEINVFEHSKKATHNDKLSLTFRADNARTYKVGYAFAGVKAIVIQTLFLIDKKSREEYRQKKNY